MNNVPVKYDEPTLMAIKNTIAKGASPEEFELFIQLCKSTGLNPFKREIWFIKTDRGVQIMTGINGFYAIANSHPQFDGLEVETVEADGQLVKALARCYRKDRSRPMVAEAYYSEYHKPYGNWKVMPRLMLSKCAESMALRKSFPQELNALYSAEEMPAEFQASVQSESATPPPMQVVTVEHKPTEYYYDITAMDAAKVDQAEAYLQSAGARPNADANCWISAGPLGKLKNYRIGAEEFNRRIAQTMREMEEIHG